MRKITKRTRRIFTGLGVGMIIIVVFFLSISFLAKYILQKYDVQWLGREITVGHVYVNLFTGFVHISNIRIAEAQGDSIFLTAEGASANFTLRKLFNKTIEIRQLTVDRPLGTVVQRDTAFNFNDLVRRFTSDDSVAESPWHVTLLHTKIIDGEFHYREQIIPINYFIRNVNIESDGKTRLVDTIAARFSFRDGKKDGTVNGYGTLNQKNLDYKLALNIHDFDLEIIRQYIWELINYGMFTARMDGSIHTNGNLSSQESVTVKGRLAVRDFHLGKTTEEDYLSFEKMEVVMEEFSPIHRKYLFDSIILTKPFLKYESYDSLDNVQAMFGKKGKNISDITGQAGRFNLVIEIARYIKVLSRNFFRSEYKIGKLALRHGDFVYNDYSLSEKYSIEATPLTITADSVNNNHKRVEVLFSSAIRPYGEGKIFLSINPKDSTDFDMRYDLQKIPAASFNPYLISYTSFPLDRGTLAINGSWVVRNGIIKSTNHLVVIDPRVTKRIKNHDLERLPMPLIMSFIRETGNVIDYEIPITGNLKNPKFHLSDVIWDIIGNIFIKPPSTPYREEVRNFETEIEKSLTVKWEGRQNALSAHQGKFVNQISKFLKDNPAATITVSPIEYSIREKEYILFFETKKKYFLMATGKHRKDFNEKDSLEVSAMSVKDPLLVKHISKSLSDTVMFTLQEKCINYVGASLVNIQFKKLVKDRELSFRQYFISNGTNERVNMRASQNTIPYDGFSYFKLAYPGETPKDLLKAYEKMNELNDDAPRKQYLKERKAQEKAERNAGRNMPLP